MDAQPAAPFDLVLAGGRVMDPASGLDAIRHVGIRGGTDCGCQRDAAHRASRIVDVSGLVVAPGFIDPHSHAQTLEGNQFQARDGVTTALELESGAMPIGDWYRSREGQALLNYGATIGHIYSRIAVMHEKVDLGRDSNDAAGCGAGQGRLGRSARPRPPKWTR